MKEMVHLGRIKTGPSDGHTFLRDAKTHLKDYYYERSFKVDDDYFFLRFPIVKIKIQFDV